MDEIDEVSTHKFGGDRRFRSKGVTLYAKKKEVEVQNRGPHSGKGPGEGAHLKGQEDEEESRSYPAKMRP